MYRPSCAPSEGRGAPTHPQQQREQTFVHASMQVREAHNTQHTTHIAHDARMTKRETTREDKT